MVVGPEQATLESSRAFAAAATGRRFSRGRSSHRTGDAPKEVIVFGWFVPLAQQSGGGSAGLLITLGLMFVVFYFLLIRPQQRRARAQKELMSGLDVGDDVVTIGGMFGTITDLDDTSATIEVADGVEIRMLRSAIARKVTEPADDDDVSDDEDEEDDDEPLELEESTSTPEDDVEPEGPARR
jgi:preprotein translocase subunit YajC